MDKTMIKDSKLLSYYLRHKPDEIRCAIDSEGWVNVRDICNYTKFTPSYIEQIVEDDTRYQLSEDKQFVRALHGHSIPGVNAAVKDLPDGCLYHGTSTKAWEQIKETGKILPMSRNFVHLDICPERAKSVGARHGKPIVLVIDTEKLSSEYSLYRSGDNVYLVEEVPLSCIKEVLEEM